MRKISYGILFGVIIIISILMITEASAFNIDKFWERISQRPNFEKLITRCNRDRDCFKTTISKCSCERGGKEIAVNKFGLEYYNWKKQNTGFVFCSMVYRCTNLQPKCENKICVLK